MKIAHVLVPDFPIQVEVTDDPSLKKEAVVIGGKPHEDGTVYACSPKAQRHGVRIGIPLRQAEQLSPQATFLPADLERYRRFHKMFLRTLSPFSPQKETVALGEVSLEASGLERLHGPDQELSGAIVRAVEEGTGLLSQVGVATNKFVAAVAARLVPPGGDAAVPLGEEASFLAPLPLDHLPASEETRRLLGRLGLSTIGQVAEMPAGSLARTLGLEGELLHNLARGRDARPLHPQYEASPLSGETLLDFAVEDLEVLLAYAERLIEPFSQVLEREGLLAGAIAIEIAQEDGETLQAAGNLQEATRDPERLAERASVLLESLEYTAGVTDLRIGLFPLRPFHEESRQETLLGHLPPFRPERFQRLIHAVHERFGEYALRPAAELPPPPPLPVEVRANGAGRPQAVVHKGGWHQIRAVPLHWRLEGDWRWGEGRKEYFQVETEEGEILVLLHEPQKGRWYLHKGAQPSRWPDT